MKKNLIKKIVVAFMMLTVLFVVEAPAFAAEEAEVVAEEAGSSEVAAEDAENPIGDKAMAAAIAIGLAAGAGAIGMGMAVAKAAEGISRQPEAEGKIRTTLMLGLVFVETAIIYALVIAILIIFVL